MEFKVTASQWEVTSWGYDPHTEHADQQKKEGVLPGDFECHCGVGEDIKVKNRVFISDNEWCLADHYYRVTMLLDLTYTEWTPGDEGQSFGKVMGMRRSCEKMAKRLLDAGYEAGYDIKEWVRGY